MERINPITTPAPRLPQHGAGGRIVAAVVAVALHGAAAGAVMAIAGRSPAPVMTAAQAARAPQMVSLKGLVFMQPASAPGGGGGGGGNRQTAPIRRASAAGTDEITLRVRKPAIAEGSAVTAESLPALVLDARPLASGTFDAAGLPSGGVDFGTALGPGSGGGVGDGVGTGLGSGRGPGLGPGEGGGTGGGVYRPGGAVSAPRLVSTVQPVYTSDALAHHIEGTVRLQIVVRRDGCASDIRVVRSLDAGLDAQAIRAVREWRFAPGELGGTAVDVEATVVVDFRIR